MTLEEFLAEQAAYHAGRKDAYLAVLKFIVEQKKEEKPAEEI